MRLQESWRLHHEGAVWAAESRSLRTVLQPQMQCGLLFERHLDVSHGLGPLAAGGKDNLGILSVTFP